MTGHDSLAYPRRAGWLSWRLASLLAAMVALATTIALRTDDVPYEDRLLDLTARRYLPADLYGQLRGLDGLEALVMASADSQELAAKMQFAQQKYPEDTPQVLAPFGTDPAFQQALKDYGEGIVPVVAYFMQNDLPSIRAQFSLAQKIDSLKKDFQKALDWLHNRPTAEAHQQQQQPAEDYSPELRGRYALQAIGNDGHKFLGQFVLDAQHKAHWVQSERVLDIGKWLLFSGVTDLERKHLEGKPLTLPDYAWAGVDIAVLAGAVKALKALKAPGVAGKELKEITVAEKTMKVGQPLLRGSTWGSKALGWGAKVGTVYLVLRHPELLSSLFAAVAKALGLPAWLGMAAGWSFVLCFLLLPVLLALRLLVALASPLLRGLRWLLRPARAAAGSGRGTSTLHISAFSTTTPRCTGNRRSAT